MVLQYYKEEFKVAIVLVGVGAVVVRQFESPKAGQKHGIAENSNGAILLSISKLDHD